MVASNGDLWLFGGQGKKLLSDFWRIDVARGEVAFHEITPGADVRSNQAPTLPSPRKGHTLTYEPSLNALILFGGTGSSGADNSLWLYNIESNQWSQPKCTGSAPPARTNHSAVAISKHHVLFWGGCSTDGVFFSDSIVLDTRQWHFHKPQLLNPAPSQRYHHTCVTAGVEGKAILYGGINQKQTFGSVALIEHRLMAELAPALNLIASELQNLTRTSIASGSSRGGGPAPITCSQQPIILTAENFNSMRWQAQQGLNTNQPATSSLLPVQKRESGPIAKSETTSVSTLQDQLMRNQLTDLFVKRDLQEMHSQASKRLDDLDSEVDLLKRELATVKMIKEEAELEAAAARESARKSQVKAEKEAEAAAALRGKLQETESMLRESRVGRESSERRVIELTKELGLVTSRLSKVQSEGHIARLGGLGGREGERRDIPVAATASSSSNVGPLGSSRGSEGVGAGVERDEMAPLPALLSASERRCESLASEVRTLVEGKVALSERVSRLEGDGDAIRKMRLNELKELQSKLEDSLRSVKAAAAVEERIEKEVELRLAERQHSVASLSAASLPAAQEQNICCICLERGKEIVFQCGHQACLTCGEGVEACPFCRKTITHRIKLYSA